jgi:hypothetical protein
MPIKATPPAGNIRRESLPTLATLAMAQALAMGQLLSAVQKRKCLRIVQRMSWF